MLGNQDLKCPYLAEILDAVASSFFITSATYLFLTGSGLWAMIKRLFWKG